MSVSMAVPAARSVPRVMQLQAATLIVVVIACMRLLPFRAVHGMTTRLNRLPGKPADHTAALMIVAAVRHAASWWPGRAACLETSLAATWLAALRGQPVTWCHGVRPHPYTFHAWVEADQTPVDEPATTRAYLRTTSIPARTIERNHR